MNVNTLRQIYRDNEVVRAICDHMATRAKNQNETYTHRMEYWLNADGHDFKRSEIIAAFRHIEESECGRYVEGRHGWKSRFIWSVKSKLVADAAMGMNDTAMLGIDDVPEDLEEELIEHIFVLRPDLTVSFELPADLTPNEARRLSQFIDALSFEE